MEESSNHVTSLSMAAPHVLPTDQRAGPAPRGRAVGGPAPLRGSGVPAVWGSGYCCCRPRARPPLPEHPWGPGLRQLLHLRTTPSASLARPSQLGTPISSSVSRARLHREKTHTMEFYRIRPASSGSEGPQHAWPVLLSPAQCGGTRGAPGRRVALGLHRGCSQPGSQDIQSARKQGHLSGAVS